MKTLKEALESADKEFKPMYQQLADATWEKAAALAAEAGRGSAFQLSYMKPTYDMWVDWGRNRTGLPGTASQAELSFDVLAAAQQKYQRAASFSETGMRQPLTAHDTEILNEACIQSGDTLREVRERMKEGGPREYAAAVTYDMTPAVAEEVTNYFMTNLQQMNPNMPANQAYAQAMYSALREFEIANDTGRNAEMLNNGTSLAISLAKMDVQLDMQEMGIDDRDDIGDDEVGDDD